MFLVESSCIDLCHCDAVGRECHMRPEIRIVRNPITEIMATDEALKYSLWLVPPESFRPSAELSKLTTTTFPGSEWFPSSPGFKPHITLTSRIPKPGSPL